MSQRLRSHPRLLPWISLLVVWIVWGSTYLAMRVVVGEMPPAAAAAVRFLTAGTLMAAVAFVVDRRHGWPSRRQWADYSLVGVLLLSVGNSLVMWSERTVPSGIAALIVATVPVWILLLDGLRPGGRPWTLRLWIGTAVGLVGVALVARPGGSTSTRATRWRSSPCRSPVCPGPSARSTRRVCAGACPSPRRPRSRCWWPGR